MNDITSNTINKFKNNPIPKLSYDIESVKHYQKIKIDEQCSEYVEDLVDIKDVKVKGINYYHTSFNPPYYHSVPGSIADLRIRKTVAEKLAIINSKIEAFGLELFVFDGFRPLAVQNYFYYQWVPQYLRSIYPHKDEEWIKKEAGSYWAKGAHNQKDLLASIPPHSTGGAVDLTLCFKESGHLLEMGSIFDDISDISHTSYFEENQNPKSFTVTEALKNRRLLYHLMISEGFSSHPKEWWHFSYGDQMWALISEKQKALYGYAGNKFDV